MKHLLISTAVIALMATPSWAQSTNSSTAKTDEAQNVQPSNMETGNAAASAQMSIEISTLLDRRVYIPIAGTSDAQATEDATNGSMNDEQTATSDMTQSDIESDETRLTESSEVDTTDTDKQAQDSAATAGDDPLVSRHADLPESVAEAQENWRMVGEIDDLLIDTSGQISAVLIDAGGFLGMAENAKQVDISEIKFIRDSDDEGEYFVVFNGDRSMLERQANYDAEQANAQQMRRYSEETGIQNREQLMEKIDLAQVTTEELLGAAAYGSNDNWVGEVSELALAEDGKINSVIVDVGGFLGIGEKPVSIPLDKVELRRIGSDGLRAYISATEAEMDEMPEYEGNES